MVTDPTIAQPEEVEEEVLDPVCGMMILPEDAVDTVEHAGQTIYFCNRSCVEKFKADPEKYLSPRATEAAPEGAENAEYICPMDPEVHQLGPGACPKCGMALEPAEIAAPATRTGVHLPDARGDCARGAGELPEVRHGARAAGGDGGRSEPGA